MRDPKGGETVFGVEDMNGFLEYVKEEVGLTDQEHLRAMLEIFCRQFSPAFVGKAARSALLSRSVGEKLLLTHMPKDDPQRPKRIIEALNKSFYHHGYPINRDEVRANDLPLSPPGTEVRQVEKLIWKIWSDIERDLQFRVPFDPHTVLLQSPSAAQLLGPVPQINLPGDAPQEVINQVLQQVMANAVQGVPPAEFQFTPVVVESARRAAHYTVRGQILASRMPNLTIQSNVLFSWKGWESLPVQPA
ncbi:MAG TPA: hypothetical protein VHR66_14245 [Gemmataceae bacterium]|jgi:hypothetical protein|nr:hypothetical protein [Gemmataceae bacterium]